MAKVRPRIVTNGDLMEMLEESARAFCPKALESIVRNRHMNALTGNDIRVLMEFPEQQRRIAEALIVAFANHIIGERGGDFGLYTRHLREK